MTKITIRFLQSVRTHMEAEDFDAMVDDEELFPTFQKIKKRRHSEDDEEEE